MFKKTLAAAAVLCAFAGSAFAADVQIYGRVNVGLNYTNSDADIADAALASGDSSKDALELTSGDYTSSRWGIKGSEDLGNGLTVGFVLENGYKADSGSFSTSNTLFDRESIAYLEGNWGKLAFGRVAIIASDGGSFQIGGALSPFGTGLGVIGNQNAIWGAGYASRNDNTISYRSPSFAGFQLTAQYSFGENSYTDSDTKDVYEEGTTRSNRYAGLGLTYKQGPADFALVVDWLNKAHLASAKEAPDDTFRVILGGSYDFNIVKPYLAVSYYKDGALTDSSAYDRAFADQKGIFGLTNFDGVLDYNYDSYGAILGAEVPAFGGAFHGMVGYQKADYQSGGEGVDDVDFERWMVGLSYDYALSKRTKVYVGTGYYRDDLELSGSDTKYDANPDTYQVVCGMAHYF